MLKKIGNSYHLAKKKIEAFTHLMQTTHIKKSFMVKGYRRTITEHDFWELVPIDNVYHLLQRFSNEWAKELQKSNRRDTSRENHNTENGSTMVVREQFGKEDLSTLKFYNTSSKFNNCKPSLNKTLAKSFGFQYLMSAVLKLPHDVLLFVSPWLLGKLISFIKTGSDDLLWAYSYAVLLFVCGVLQSLLIHQYFHICHMIGTKVRSVIIAAVYEKMLHMNTTGRRAITAGEMVNLISVDSQKCFDLLIYLNMIWSGPLQVLVALCFLYQLMGWSVIAGFVITVLIVPVTTIATSKEKEYTSTKMKHKDERSKLMTEIINYINILKLYTWEESYIFQVIGLRRLEIKELRKSKLLKANYEFLLSIAPFLASFSTFAIYVSLGHTLTAEKAFVALSLFNIIEFPILILPVVVTNFAQYYISNRRIERFLQSEELDFQEVKKDQKEGNDKTIAYIKNGNFYWTSSCQPVLRDINVTFEKESLSAIVGQVGAGKSSLLSALLGEIEKLSGEVGVFGKVAYVAQQPWIQNATVRENILFGKPYNKVKYDHIIEACSLKSDLDLLPGGDLTEIGEKGINLSGGQKQRVALARAVYNNADIYIFDDPLSAVDVHVGKHIFDQVFGHEGLLQTKARIMVTHNLTFLPHVDKIVVLKDGKISEIGNFVNLSTSNAAEFAQLKEIYSNKNMACNQRNQPQQKCEFDKSVNHEVDHMLLSSLAVEDVELRMLLKEYINVELDETNSKNVMILEEKSEKGRVKRSVFGVYARSLGIIFTILVLFFAFGKQALLIGTRFWLAKWSSDYNFSDSNYYLNIYGVIGGGLAVCIWIENILVVYCTTKACVLLHDSLLKSVMRNPMSFFETTPMGRIVNRFSKDIHTIDEQLPQSLNSFINLLTRMVGTIFVIGFSTPIFFAVLIPLALIYFFTQRFYVATSRQLKRIESVKRSPIYNHFFESIYGASTIRAFGYKDKFIEDNVRKVDVDQAAWFISLCANRWLGIRLDITGNLIILFAALSCIINRDTITPGIAGLSVSYAIQVTQVLGHLVSMTSQLESNIISVERVKEYIDTPSEPAWEVEETKPLEKWPSKGEIKFEDFSVRYRDGLDLALKKINCHIKGNEKVGIVGRTGAGKSTLISALFRIIEASGGKITIDGVDIATLGLKHLRSKLTVIPQDPVLFSGSIRFNLDPFYFYDDEAIWHALKVANLSSFVGDLKEGLEYEIFAGGENLSIGQRQLICLGRALLRKSKILILDEATAAVDMETDSFIQKTIREEFKYSTVLTIAHRLNTIIDYDKIMVLSEGELKEFDSPENLLADTTSIFYGMAKDAGLTD